MREPRFSHSYCTPCDVFFLRADACPRCRGTDNLMHPPTGSPPLAPGTPCYGGKWIERDEDARERARVDNGCINGHDPDEMRIRPNGTPWCRKCAANNRARRKAS